MDERIAVVKIEEDVDDVMRKVLAELGGCWLLRFELDGCYLLLYKLGGC